MKHLLDYPLRKFIDNIKTRLKVSVLQYFNIPNYTTKTGKTSSLKMSYQLFGKPLYEAPIVLINHALTGNSNVTGESGWWTPIVGPGKVD